MSQGSDPSIPGAHPHHSQMGGSMPDIRAQGAGTYFLGRYRIVDEIGIGGMASVHLARMDGPGGFQKWVAIKKIHPHLVEDESFVQMFLDEARVAARISHPNVATVFDLGKHEDTYWIAMEYLHGEPLREVMRRTEELGTAMPPEIACRVIADAAEGLHAAHELLGKNGEKLGLVHRDVTPHNLFVTYDGVTKVVDFGIAKFSSRMSHTRAGTLKGKLAYMSPEQVHGEGIDRRTDIFALGVVLWELTTGQRLFRMESDLDTLAKVQECNVPRPSTLIRGYPVDLEKIVMKALAKNRGERFRTARELSRALQSLLMRRGLFIASDEVAAYTQSIFNERIQKREAHLRWAAEVTSTINVDQLLSKPQLGADFTGNSDVQAQAQAKPGGIRPAAGMPAAAPITGPMAEPAAQDPYGRAPDPLKSTGPSLPTQARPVTGPFGSAAVSQPPRAPVDARRPGGAQAPAPPRPAAGLPPSVPHARQTTPDVHAPQEEAHPADGDGPTIQALPPMLDALAPRPDLGPRLGPAFPAAGRGPSQSEPPTLMGSPQARSESENDGPTMMVFPTGRGGEEIVPSDEVMALTDDDEFDEDQDATKVAASRADANPLQAPPTFPQVAPAAGRSMAPSPPNNAIAPIRPAPQMLDPTVDYSNRQQQQHQQHQQQQSYPGMPSQQPSPMMAPFGYPPPPQPFSQGPAHTGEIPFDGGYPPMQQQPPQDFGRSGANPTGDGQQFIPRQSPRMQPGMNRVQYDNRTMTVERYRRRPPMWVVAALSCSIALLIAGVVIAIVSSTGSSSSPAPNATASGAPTTSGAASVASTASAAGVTSAGPFSAARAAFETAIAQPGASAAPPTAASAAPTAPPVMAAAADPAPPVSAAAAAPVEPPAAPVTAAAPAPAAPAPKPVAIAQPVASPPAAKKPAALGALTVVCMPKCDQIIDNGTSLGPGHIFNRPVPSGRHVLQLSAPNGARKNLVVEVLPDQTKEVRMSMDK